MSILLVMVLATSLFACGGGETPTGENSAGEKGGSVETSQEGGTSDKPLSGKHLIIGTSAAFKNFETVAIGDDGKETYEGLDIDLVAKMAEDMGFTYEFSNMQFSGLVGALQANRVDMVISGMSPTDERKEAVDFSDGYLTARQAFLVQKDSGITTEKDLEGKTVSCSTGTAYEDLARSIPKAKVTTFDGQAAVLQELLNKRTDAMVTDGSLIQGFMEEHDNLYGFMLPKDSPLTMKDQTVYAMAFPKGSELVPLFNEEIETLKGNGELDKIVARWLGDAYIGE